MDIPGYKIIDTLGQGGMATVYLAIQESFEREVALKVMSPSLSADHSFGERFVREARIMSRLVHPNIVTVYDVGVHDGHHFLSMEYVPGRDLKHRRFELNLHQSLQVIKDIARALDYAGRKGYVHRDVKPENIMLHADDGRAVLMDFGIARPSDLASGMTLTGTAIGTPYYMSPEQARGELVDHRADIYSLGVVAFLLLSGRVPYDADSAVAVGIMHLTAEIPRLPDHLRVFQPLIDRAMAKDPARRYQSGSELIEDLRAIPSADIVLALAACNRQLVIDDGDSISLTMLSPTPINTAIREVLPFAKAVPGTSETEIYIPSEQLLALSSEDRAEHQRQISAGESSGEGSGEGSGRIRWWLGLLLTAAAIGAYVWYLTQIVSPRTQLEPGVISAPTAEPENPAPNNLLVGPAAIPDPVAQRRDQATDAPTDTPEPEENSVALLLEDPPAPAVDTLRDPEAAVESPAPVDQEQLLQQESVDEAVPLTEAVPLADLSPALDEPPAAETETAGDAVESALPEPVIPIATGPQILHLQVSAHELNEAEDLYREQPPTISVDRIIYLGFGYRYFPQETSVIQAILYEGSRDVQIAQVPVIVSGDAGVSFFRMERPVSGFPDGTYTVDLQLGDDTLVSIPFNVKRYP